MSPRTPWKGVAWIVISSITGLLLQPLSSAGAPVRVRYVEGLVHGFLVLRAPDGRTLADGDLTQVIHGSRAVARLVLRFRDGSVHDETVVYSQRRFFHLLSDHMVQRGPTFPGPMDFSIDARTRRAIVRYRDKGKTRVQDERMEMPLDLSNGLLQTLLKNVVPGAPETLSVVAATPKPMLVKLVVVSVRRERFLNDRSWQQALHFVLRTEIPGVKGVIARLIGKQPPDSHVWILGGSAPAFLKAQTPLYVGGPSWTIELSSPRWPALGRGGSALRATKK